MYRPSFFQFMVHCLMQSSFSSVLPLTVYFVFQDRFCSVYIPLVCLVIMQLLEQFPVDHLFQSCLLFFFFFQSQFATFAYLWFTAPSSIPSTFTVFVLLFFCWILYNRFPLRFDLWVYIHHLDRFSKCLPFVFPFYSSSMIARSTQFLIFLPFFFNI